MGDPERVLRELGADPDVSIEIEDGSEHFRGGLTRLVLRGDGHAQVEHRVAGELETYEGRLDANRLAEVGTELAQSGFATLEAPARLLVAGEAEVALAVRRNGSPLHVARIPDDARNDDERLETVLDVFARLVWEITGGELPKRARG